MYKDCGPENGVIHIVVKKYKSRTETGVDIFVVRFWRCKNFGGYVNQNCKKNFPPLAEICKTGLRPEKFIKIIRNSPL